MIKRLSIILLLMSLVLAACQGSTPVVESETEAVSVTESPATLAPTSTSTKEVQPTEEPTSSPTSAKEASGESLPPAGCTVVSPQPTPGPTQRSIFPPVSEDDWVQGPEDAYVTIIEYADFQ